MTFTGTPLGVGVDRLAAELGDKPAIVCGDEVVSWRDFGTSSTRLARHFRALGVGAGSTVTIGLPNSIRFYQAVAACWKVGAIPQPVSHRLPAAELAAIVEVADPDLVVGLEVADRPWLPAGFTPDQAISDVPLEPVVSPSWKAPTSGGSTGRPKIIESATPGILEEVVRSAPRLCMQPDEVFLCTGPLYHNAPLGFSLTALLLGGTVVLMPRFDAAASLELAGEHGVTWFYLVPTMMQRILRLPQAVRDAARLDTVRVFYHLGAPCPPAVKRAWIDWVGGKRLFELYAGTEAQASTLIDGDEWLAHPGSVGRVGTGEMKILGPDGVELPAGEVGKIWVRSRAPTYRYRGAEPQRLDGGWESLGDMGYFDDDGYLYLTDREADMVLVGGANVYPAEIEAALAEHPSVLSSCVIGLPDDEYGNRIHAVVELREPVSDEELARHLAERLAPYKLPRSYERSSTALRDDAGKVRRSAVRSARLPAAGGST